MKKKKTLSKIKKDTKLPIINSDGSIINYFQLGKFSLKLKVSLNGCIEEFGENKITIIKDNEGYNIIQITEIKEKSKKQVIHTIEKKDIFLLKIFNKKYSENSWDYNIDHIDGNKANDSLDNLAIINQWSDKIINPPFRKLNYNTTEILKIDRHNIEVEFVEHMYEPFGFGSKKIYVFKDGRINDENNKPILREFDEDGYEHLLITLLKTKKEKKIFKPYVHGIILRCFCENSYNTVHHIDKNKLNNSYSNLKIFDSFSNIGTEIYDNKNKYFVFNLTIDMDKELFTNSNMLDPKTLSEYPDLEIYPTGIVINKTGKSEMRTDDKGYQRIRYQAKSIGCHQLVAKAFLKNPSNYNMVNHLDGNKSNNNILNLEWVNNSFNMLNWRSGSKIPFTSRNYKEFIYSRILLEKDIEVEYWIFSNRDPFKLFYCVLAKENLFSKLNMELKGFNYKKIMQFLNNETFNNLKNNEREVKIVKLLERHTFPLSKEDHIILLLKEIGVDFKDYFNWLFDELKTLVKDEVGFIFFEEFKQYYKLMHKSKEGVYVNSILEANEHQNNYYERRGIRSLKKNRMIEKFGHHAQGQPPDQRIKNEKYEWAHYPWDILDEMPEKDKFGYRN